MNNRTITHNAQIDQIIGALQPKAEKPAPLSSTWLVLHEKAMETAKIANEHCWPNDPPDDGVCGLVIVLIIGAIALFKLSKE